MEIIDPDLLEFSYDTKDETETFNIENTEKNNEVETKYICSQCNQGFHAVSNLTIHVENKHGKKDQVCPICGLGFSKAYIQR